MTSSSPQSTRYRYVGLEFLGVLTLVFGASGGLLFSLFRLLGHSGLQPWAAAAGFAVALTIWQTMRLPVWFGIPQTLGRIGIGAATFSAFTMGVLLPLAQLNHWAYGPGTILGIGFAIGNVALPVGGILLGASAWATHHLKWYRLTPVMLILSSIVAFGLPFFDRSSANLNLAAATIAFVGPAFLAVELFGHVWERLEDWAAQPEPTPNV